MNSNSKNDPEAIRSDIDDTRHRMDNTMDALGDRLQPQHLLDEVLGLFRRRSESGESKLPQIREKISRSADAAVSAVVDTVKSNPMPALLIGAGVAWMIYESTRDKSADYRGDDRMSRDRNIEGVRYDPDTHYDRPLEYPASAEWSDQGGSKLGEIKDKLSDKASAATDQVKDKLSQAGEAVREKTSALRERAGEKLEAAKQRAGEVAAKVKDNTRAAYVKTRERVVTTADQRPIEVGLVALAAGLIVGLTLPTPNAVNRTVGPTADRLRQRTREASSEMLEKGKRVARAAVNAVKDEAQAQGFTRTGNGDREQQPSLALEGNQSGSQTGTTT